MLLVGGDLVLDWTRTGAKGRQVEFEVTGTGTLRVQVNGALVGEYGEGRQSVSFESVTGTDTLTLTYVPGADDAGGAVVRACRRVQGSLLIVR